MKPDFTALWGEKVFKMIPVETFRGCPYSCTYCNSPTQREFSKNNNLGNFLRRKSMDVLRQEICDYIETYEPGFFYFVDDVFLARPKSEIFEFCDMYQEFGLPFWFNTRSESCEPDILARLKKLDATGYHLELNAVMNSIVKKYCVAKSAMTNLYTVFNEIIAKSGIVFSLNVIIGMPGETRELVMDTVELIRSIEGYDALTVSIFLLITALYCVTLLLRTDGWTPKLLPRTQRHVLL